PATTIVPSESEPIMARRRNPRLPNNGKGSQARTFAMRLRATSSASVALAMAMYVSFLMLTVNRGGRPTTKLSDGAPTAPPASGRSALAQKVMVRARAPALYGSCYKHFMCLAVRCSAELGGGGTSEMASPG